MLTNPRSIVAKKSTKKCSNTVSILSELRQSGFSEILVSSKSFGMTDLVFGIWVHQKKSFSNQGFLDNRFLKCVKAFTEHLLKDCVYSVAQRSKQSKDKNKCDLTKQLQVFSSSVHWKLSVITGKMRSPKLFCIRKLVQTGSFIQDEKKYFLKILFFTEKTTSLWQKLLSTKLVQIPDLNQQVSLFEKSNFSK